MTRTQECRAQLAWIETNCPLDRTSIIPIKKAAEFCDKHVEISTMSTDAIQPLVKVKDAQVQDAVVASLKTMIDAGKKPTRKEVERVINITTTAPHREELIKRGKESDADPEGIKLYCGDFLTDYIKIPAGSIDCIITDPGDTVLDPFCGSGTVLSMAKKMSRRAIGFDNIPENVAIAKGRCAS